MCGVNVTSLIQSLANRLGYEIHRLPTHDKFTREQIEEMVNRVPLWWHTITLPHGIKTPGQVPEAGHERIAKAIPTYLKGKNVLDIGTWDGYYSFLCEARGASRVLAIDNLQYKHRPEFKGSYRSGFETAKQILDSKVDYRMLDVDDLDSIRETFDLVLFLGVYYHVRHPFLSLEKVAAKTKKLLILEGTVYPHDEPVMKFRGGKGDDPTCWWDASENCLIAMLKSLSFDNVETVYKDYNEGRIIVRAER